MAEDNGQGNVGNPNATTEQTKRGPGRPPKPAAGADVQKTETVTYVPLDPLDPTVVKWGGHTFQANVPKPIAYTEFADPDAAPHPNKTLIERARDNRTFRVGNAAPVNVDPGKPTTPEQYRAHVVKWLNDIGRNPDQPGAKTAGCTEALIKRWAADRDLRELCGVGTDDYIYLGSLIDPKLSECQRADDLTNEQLRALWVQHGVMELPWR